MTGFEKKDYYYELPEELIAQDPLKDRSSSRLMVLDKNSGEVNHRIFRDITEYLEAGDCLVMNDTKVIPARLLGQREGSGGAVEVLLLKRLDKDEWECLVKPGKKMRPGMRAVFGDASDPELKAEVLEELDDGKRKIRFEYKGIFEEVLDRLGEMPLPPYITHKLAKEDRDRYQTVYAKNSGSAAAPTAGLHFTNELIAAIEAKGIKIAKVTLHVGLGTFRPVKADNILDHHMHSEHCEVSEETAELVNACKKAGGRVVCVGTTSVRTLESMTGEDGILKAGTRETEIFIYPGYKFKITDALITNFHLPESTLIMLVSALAGRKNVLKAYEEAVSQRYRFFSFGDAMFIH
ncbi:MAG: tRNA preQ1(34) S-adenosylmethionine ribosyltransferase-isomerase QueA [Lachnospiraceae bacterium]|nr:tRNA preQ1(34) S-adenosylmethionine ribosyltransferase-isomerase QueA [Lachnospiraceae bacterium]